MYIVKVQGRGMIPDHVQIRDENFVLVAYLRADKGLKNLDRYGLSHLEETINDKLKSIPYGKIEQI
jgi:hypothetical protein